MSPEPSSADLKNRRKQPQLAKDKDLDTQSIGGSIPSDALKRKKHQHQAKDDSGLPTNLPASFKVPSFSSKDGQHMTSSNEDYDEGVTDVLVNLFQTHPAKQSASAHDNYNAMMHSLTLSNASHHTINFPHDAAPHHQSMSSSNGPSPASSRASSLK
ncbi:hypothetical protein F5J12DRAFT_899403 [Pisolithus orientalis]|uniref:uncharacterized protein n=1 Tax=Pisolithus orientalis TaxID=936130 RepID=UPI002224F400|nr:uncharacterized protein F5J12DRAFT_899403 [Pisolithus orientalis]KAI5984113.1 hypothetical protein F5J12DRAFT_899403 [Pisolithus orientalis]